MLGNYRVASQLLASRVVLSSIELFLIGCNCMKHSQTILYTWNFYLLPLATPNWVARWRRMTRIRRNVWDQSLRLIHSSSAYIALERQFALPWTVASAEAGYVCQICLGTSVQTKGIGATRELIRSCARECVRRLAYQIGATGNPLCVENPSFPHREQQRRTFVKRCNSKTLRFCERVRRCTGGHSGCLECHIVLCWSTFPLEMVALAIKMSDVGSQSLRHAFRIQSVTIHSSLSRVVIFILVFMDSTITSDVRHSPLSDGIVSSLMRCDIPMNSAWFQQDGAEPQTTNMDSAFFFTFSKRETRGAGILCRLRKDFHGRQPHLT
jgi:hypothetical protein